MTLKDDNHHLFIIPDLHPEICVTFLNFWILNSIKVSYIPFSSQAFLSETKCCFCLVALVALFLSAALDCWRELWQETSHFTGLSVGSNKCLRLQWRIGRFTHYRWSTSVWRIQCHRAAWVLLIVCPPFCFVLFHFLFPSRPWMTLHTIIISIPLLQYSKQSLMIWIISKILCNQICEKGSSTHIQSYELGGL